MKKAGIPFGFVINTKNDIIGIADSFTLAYRKQGDAGVTFTALPGTVTELGGGAYELMITFAEAGTYDVKITSTDAQAGLDGYIAVVPVGVATVDDVFAALTASGLDIAAIKAKVETLNTDELTAIKTGVTDTLTLLHEVNTMMGDTELAGVTSLKELLIEIGNSETAQTGLVNALQTANTEIKRILMGAEEFLSDGTTPNPHYLATNVELKSLVTTTAETLKTSIESARDAILTDAASKQTYLVTKLDAITTLVTSNESMLKDSGYGLQAIMTALEAVKTNTNGGTTTIIDALNDASHGLAAIMAKAGTVLTAVETVGTKVDGVAAIVNDIKTSQAGSKSISVSF